MPITRMGYVALRVADLERAVAFATRVMGLRESARVDGTAYLTCNDRHHELVLVEDSAPSLDRIGLEVQRVEDLDKIRAALRTEGCEILPDESPEPGVNHALRFVGPQGFRFEVFQGMSHDQPALYSTLGERPKKFGHATLKTSDLPLMESFLERVLGFRVSDRVGKLNSWMRCNFDHHGIALVQADMDGLHHYDFELEDFTALGRVGDHLRTSGLTFLWGPGRHGAGNNLFCYFFDPDGFIVEYHADIQRIDDEAAHVPGDWPDQPLTVSQWGYPPPAAFLEGGIKIFHGGKKVHAPVPETDVIA